MLSKLRLIFQRTTLLSLVCFHWMLIKSKTDGKSLSMWSKYFCFFPLSFSLFCNEEEIYGFPSSIIFYLHDKWNEFYLYRRIFVSFSLKKAIRLWSNQPVFYISEVGISFLFLKKKNPPVRILFLQRKLSSKFPLQTLRNTYTQFHCKIYRNSFGH